MTARELDRYIRALPTDELEALMDKATAAHRALERMVKAAEDTTHHATHKGA